MTTYRPVATEDLFTYAQRTGFESMSGLDYFGLQAACRRVWELMRDGQWHSATEIIDAAKQREGLRRMRDLTQIGYTIEKHRPEGSREWRYRMVEA